MEKLTLEEYGKETKNAFVEDGRFININRVFASLTNEPIL